MYKDKNGDEWIKKEDYLRHMQINKRITNNSLLGTKRYQEERKNGFKKIWEVEIGND